MIVFAAEPFAAVESELVSLWGDHYREAAADRDAIPLDMDVDAYRALDDAGKLILVTARAEAALVGYATAIVGTHMHCRSHVQAVGDLHYIVPERRGPGVAGRLLGSLEAEAKARSVVRLMIATPARVGYQGRLLASLGFGALEVGYSKVLA